jgi:hypothetical protein
MWLLTILLFVICVIPTLLLKNMPLFFTTLAANVIFFLAELGMKSATGTTISQRLIIVLKGDHRNLMLFFLGFLLLGWFTFLIVQFKGRV